MLYIGIDTGTNTGVAVWDSSARAFRTVRTCGIVEAMDIVKRIKGEPLTLVIEDARLRRWIPFQRSIRAELGRAQGAGSVKRDAAIWEEFAKYYGIPLRKVAPQKGGTKWTSETFVRYTGHTGRTSNHARDAALLVFGL